LVDPLQRAVVFVATRRPSHVDERRASQRALLSEEIQAVRHLGVTEEEIQAAAERLIRLATSRE
jgi:hypothetical protein